VLCADGRERFPRLKNSKRASRRARMREQIASGHLPRGWDRLTRKQKKLAKRVGSGMKIVDACRLCHTSEKQFYRWRELHPLFRNYLRKYSLRYASMVNAHIDGALPTAVRVVEESLQSKDPYFAHEAAVQLLKGRGIYRPTSNVQGEVRTIHEGTVDVKHDHNHKMDKEFAVMFVDALKAKATGQGLKQLQPKIIDVEVLKEADAEKVS